MKSRVRAHSTLSRLTTIEGTPAFDSTLKKDQLGSNMVEDSATFHHSVFEETWWRKFLLEG